MSSGISALLLILLMVPVCVVDYILLRPHVDRANDRYFGMMSKAKKEASRKGQYMVYKTDISPNSAFGFIIFMMMASLGMITYFTARPGIGDASLDSILVDAGIIIGVWALVTVGYIYSMHSGRDELYFVSDAGIEKKVIDSRGETSRLLTWKDIDCVNVNPTDDDAKFTLTIFWASDDRMDFYGNWMNADLLCRDLLVNRPSNMFTKKAMDMLSRRAAKAGKIPRTP